MTARRGLFWPLLLIVVGLVFLLVNAGYVAPISAVALFSLWPLILVFIGIDIAFARRWPLAVIAVDVVLLAAGLALVASSPSGLSVGPFATTGGGDTTVSQPRGSARTMALRISGGAGQFNIAGATQDELVKATSTRTDLRITSTLRNDQADVRLNQGESGLHFGPTFGSTVDATIASDVPTSLIVNLGAGDFALDLSNVKLTDSNISVGAASLNVTLPTPSGEVPMTVSAGASNVVINVPAGVEARVTTSGGLTNVRFDNGRFNGNETSGYSSAKDRVTIRVSAGASSVTVR